MLRIAKVPDAIANPEGPSPDEPESRPSFRFAPCIAIQFDCWQHTRPVRRRALRFTGESNRTRGALYSRMTARMTRIAKEGGRPFLVAGMLRIAKVPNAIENPEGPSPDEPE